jgi:hypothetical protein
MIDYRHGHVSGSDSNVAVLTGPRSMTVGEFARENAAAINGTTG